jgi:hypothetical protein
VDLGAGLGKRRSAGVRAREPQHLMSCFNQFLNYGRPDEACSSGYEYLHD